MAKQVYLAADLGAGSGRVMAAKSDGSRIYLEELHRFSNPGTDLPGGSFWNPVGLFREIVEGIKVGVERYGERVRSISVDTWGVDYALLDESGVMLGLPHQYRDPRSDGMEEEMARLIDPAEAYAHTGIMPNFYNTSLQILAGSRNQPDQLAAARHLLFIPDLLSYWLSGNMAVERTIASTSQLFDPLHDDWAWPVIDALGLPRGIFGKVVPSGTVLGPLRAESAREIGLDGIQVVAGAGHDTAAAVAGLPLSAPGSLWLSSGTWSIMGVETDTPSLTPQARAAGLCNELGVGGKVRLLKNISGLWILQECRRQWAAEGEDLDFTAMVALAREAAPFTAFINPDAPVFAAPGDMPARIREFCRQTGQSVPVGKAGVLRVATESIAMKYRFTMELLANATGLSFDRLHAGGGGIQNQLLTQATADALGIEVLAGPVEATSCGNVLVQMLALGHLPDLATGRALVRESMPFTTFTPRDPADWSEAYLRAKPLIQAVP